MHIVSDGMATFTRDSQHKIATVTMPSVLRSVISNTFNKRNCLQLHVPDCDLSCEVYNATKLQTPLLSLSAGNKTINRKSVINDFD